MDDLRLDQVEKTVFNAPVNKHISVWRYMDFTRFVSLLNSSSLHLARCDQFDDSFEGVSLVHHKVNAGLTKDRSDLSAVTEAFRKLQRQYVFINCWHVQEYESAALWKLYAKSNAAAVAIQTNFLKLREALPASCQVGEVHYIDQQTCSNNNRLYSMMYKPRSFAHEREVRICYIDTYEFFQHLKNPDEFLSSDTIRLVETIPVDLHRLIETVRIAPNAPSWLVKLVKDSLLRFDYQLPVLQAGSMGVPCQ